MSESAFSKLSDDVTLNILNKLDDYPRNWARIACASTKFSSLIRTICCRTKCSQLIPAVVSDIQTSSKEAGAWFSLYKLSVCCPGLLHSGVLLENSDFGLERELGPDENYHQHRLFNSAETDGEEVASSSNRASELTASVPACVWSLYDDLLFDTLYGDSEMVTAETALEIPVVGDRV